MPHSSVLIVGAPSVIRDSFELAARRHAFEVTICDDGTMADHGMHDGQVRAVLITSGAPEQDIDAFLSHLRSEHPQVPVFFAGEPSCTAEAQHWIKSGTIILPPDMPVTQIETILFPLGGVKQAQNLRRLSNTVTLERMEYPLDFSRARAQFENAFIMQILLRERGNISKSARTIGMARRNLQVKIQNAGIDVDRIRHET